MYSKLQIVSWIALVIGVVWIALWASARHDDMLNEAMTKFDACMVKTYGVTSAHYYAEHNSLPECK